MSWIAASFVVCGVTKPEIKFKLKYKNPAFYDELLEIETRVEKIPELKVHIGHTIRSKERNVIIVEGYIVLLFIDMETRKPVRPPDFFMEAIKPYFE